MDDQVLVHVVDSLEDLADDARGVCFGVVGDLDDLLEELTACDELQNKKILRGGFVDSLELDDVGVIHQLENSDFDIDDLLLSEIPFFSLHDLDSKLLTCRFMRS